MSLVNQTVAPRKGLYTSSLNPQPTSYGTFLQSSSRSPISRLWTILVFHPTTSVHQTQLITNESRLRSDPSISPNSSLDRVSNTPPTFELAKFCDSYVRDYEARVEFGVDSSMRGGECLVGSVRLQCSIRRCIIRGRRPKMAFVLLRIGADRLKTMFRMMRPITQTETRRRLEEPTTTRATTICCSPERAQMAHGTMTPMPSMQPMVFVHQMRAPTRSTVRLTKAGGVRDGARKEAVPVALYGVDPDEHYSIVSPSGRWTHEATRYPTGMAGEGYDIHAHFTLKRHNHLLHCRIRPSAFPEP
jgi:hypothetical protein